MARRVLNPCQVVKHMKRFATALLAAALIIPAGLAAKDNKDKVPQHKDAQIPGSGDETQIAKEVRHQLVMLPYFGVFDDLGFTVNGSTVTLLGEVTRPTLKSDAGNVVKRVEGVTNVVNNIEVLPLSPDDDRIRRGVYRAVYGDPSLSTRYGFQALPSIHIIVKNGHVRLEGVVANEGDKNIAGIRANGVPGAFSVENDLRVEGK
jgi:hyperosmotically inducible periplasmic protein